MLEKKKNRTGILIAVFVVLIALVVAIVGIRAYGSSRDDARSHIDLGNRYLSELKYEQAIAEFNAALEIDDKSVDAYVGLINTYGATGNIEAANGVLERAHTVGLSEDELQRVEDAFNGHFGMSEGTDEVDDEVQEGYLPEEYYGLIDGIYDLANTEVLGVPISEWSTEKFDEYIETHHMYPDRSGVSMIDENNEANENLPDGVYYTAQIINLENDNRILGYYMFEKHSYQNWSEAKIYDILAIQINEADNYTLLSFNQEYVSETGIDTIGTVGVPAEQFFDDHGAYELYTEMQSDKGSYYLRGDRKLTWRNYAEGVFFVSLYGEKNTHIPEISITFFAGGSQDIRVYHFD